MPSFLDLNTLYENPQQTGGAAAATTPILDECTNTSDTFVKDATAPETKGVSTIKTTCKIPELPGHEFEVEIEITRKVDPQPSTKLMPNVNLLNGLLYTKGDSPPEKMIQLNQVEKSNEVDNEFSGVLATMGDIPFDFKIIKITSVKLNKTQVEEAQKQDEQRKTMSKQEEDAKIQQIKEKLQREGASMRRDR
jgi:hypothetical protein